MTLLLGFALLLGAGVYYMVDTVGIQMTILYILAAAGVHNILGTIKRSFAMKSPDVSSPVGKKYREATAEEIKQNPEFNIVAASEKTVGQHNGKDIHEYLIMENDSVYMYSRSSTAGRAAKLAGNEIMLEGGLIYVKSTKTLNEIQGELMGEILESMGIDPNTTDEELDKIRDSLQSLLEGKEKEQNKKPRKKRATKKADLQTGTDNE